MKTVQEHMTTDFTLPLPAETFIPHRPPMRLVETLVSCSDGAGEIEALPGKDSLLVGSDGELHPVALVELIAQSYATVKGYDDLMNGRPVNKGFLVGVRKLKLTGRAFAGDRLRITIATVGAFEGFSVVDGSVLKGDTVIAAGTIKLWLVDEGTSGGVMG